MFSVTAWLCVQGLAKLIGDHAPAAVKTQQFENYFGRKIAVDASMCLYQFLVCATEMLL
jgi:flap endonuclease-1